MVSGTVRRFDVLAPLLLTMTNLTGWVYVAGVLILVVLFNLYEAEQERKRMNEIYKKLFGKDLPLD